MNSGDTTVASFPGENIGTRLNEFANSFKQVLECILETYPNLWTNKDDPGIYAKALLAILMIKQQIFCKFTKI